MLLLGILHHLGELFIVLRAVQALLEFFIGDARNQPLQVAPLIVVGVIVGESLKVLEDVILRIQFLEELCSEDASQSEASFLREFLGEHGGEVLGEEVDQGILPSLLQFHLRP